MSVRDPHPFGNDSVITLNDFSGQEIEHANFLHELGHNLDLDHMGNEDLGSKNSCVHSSVMNYRYNLTGWGTDNTPTSRRFSYSRGYCDATSDGCTNTCDFYSCVPSGQLTKKITCPGDPNATWRVSDGTCDCDTNEWLSVHLDFRNGPVAHQSGAFLPAGNNMAPYLMGTGDGLRAEHWDYAYRKLEALLHRGLREGIDFRFDPRNGKVYSVD